jgi:dienelactone hydrolase
MSSVCRVTAMVVWMLSLAGVAQRMTRPDPSDAAHPFDTPAPATAPATARQFETWRAEARSALMLPEKAPALNPRSFGSFSPMPGVTAHRVTYGTQYGMRIPAIVYTPATEAHAKLPAIVIVAGHGGDKSTWYEVYAGLLYASAGAIVITYDPIGEGERNSQHLSDARAHDTMLPGLQSPARLGGLMIGDVSQAVSYAISRPDVDSKRIAVLGYSMGSFHAAIAAGLDPRIRYLVLSGGGDLDGNGGAWDSSTKIMCQSGPYRALSNLPDKGAILYALHQRSGETLILNGTEDSLVAGPHHLQSFFVDLDQRITALTGPQVLHIQTRFYSNIGHRPSWVGRDAFTWLNDRLHFANAAQPILVGETHIASWANATGAHINTGYETEMREGGIEAVGHRFPAPTRSQLQAVPEVDWQAHQDEYTWEGFARRILVAQGLPPDVPVPEAPHRKPSR